MRDNMKACQHTLTDDAVYKEVVVIGNGPSGMVTSFMLAGNVPYLKDIPDDLPIDDMLRARLSNLVPGQSLYDVDLIELAEGLEGRSQNPIPLLMDILMRPCADLGIQADSLIEWRYDVEKQLDHIVLGRGPPGGSWHRFPAHVRTLSPGAWLSLPPHAAAGTGRLTARALAMYCRRYVHACDIQRYFRTDVVVTSVTRAPSTPGLVPCVGARCSLAAKYHVTGWDVSAGRPFRYWCRRVVLACGGNDRPNSLPQAALAGATAALHSLGDLERALDALTNNTSCPNGVGTVLVVGSGVSAADAVHATRRAGHAVLHVHRAPADALARLSPHMYPDYCQVYKMMIDGPSGDYHNYKSYADHMIIDITPETNGSINAQDPEDYAVHLKRVKLVNLVTSDIIELTVSIIVVLIGSKPNLFFLQTKFNLNCIDIEKHCKCIEEKKTAKRKIEHEDRQCFFKNRWLYIKSVLEQSIQSCKSRYLNMTEINGNDSKCEIPDCNDRAERIKCMCNNLISKLENGTVTTEIDKSDCKCDIYNNYKLKDKLDCQCRLTDPYSNGIGYGLDPKKPVDGRSNPVAIDKGTHEVLNATKGIYAIGPLTADNFIRFIPGGALAAVAHIHKDDRAAD